MAQILDFLLIGLLLVLTGVAGLQFTYLFYIERLDRERKKRLRELERSTLRLEAQLAAANERILEQDALIDKFIPASAMDEDSWAEVIDDP